MGSQPVRRPHQDLSAQDLRAVNSLHREWQDKVKQPHFVLLLQSNTMDHSFGANAWGKTWQSAVDDFYGRGPEGDYSRKCVRVVSVHQCDYPFQATNANRVDC
jgi:hypothetical protein